MTARERQRLTVVNMGCNSAIMASRGTATGLTAQAVADNVRWARERRGLSQQALSALLSDLRTPIQASAIAKIEKGTRRVDVDDLTALSVALNVPIPRLLLPETPRGPDAEVEVLPGLMVAPGAAWQWATGERSLWRLTDRSSDPEVQRRDLDFVSEHPVWLRLRRQHQLMRAAEHLLWTVGRAVDYAGMRDPSDRSGVRAAIGLASWLPMVRQSLEGLSREVDQLEQEQHQELGENG